MKIASVAEVKAKFSAYVQSSGESPVVITRNGKAVAAIIPLADDGDLERLMLGCSPKLRAILAAARQRIRGGEGIAHDDFWQKASPPSRSRSRRKSA